MTSLQIFGVGDTIAAETDTSGYIVARYASRAVTVRTISYFEITGPNLIQSTLT